MLDLSGWIGIIVGILGIFIGIMLVLVANVLATIITLKHEVHTIREDIAKTKGNPFILSPNLFFTALAREAKFWEKLNIQRADKLLISGKIVSHYISENDVIIVDSGTTIDQIPQMLRERSPKVKVYTNNLLAAISVIPPVEGFDCFLLSGRIDPLFGATYKIGEIDAPLKSIKANQIILSATAISFEEGPMLNVADHPNRLFKMELARKTLEDSESPRLLIAVDWTKFQESIDTSKRNDLNPVLDKAVWRTLRSNSNFVLITTRPPESLQTPEAIRARQTIDAFSKNKGIKVEICSVQDA